MQWVRGRQTAEELSPQNVIDKDRERTWLMIGMVLTAQQDIDGPLENGEILALA